MDFYLDFKPSLLCDLLNVLASKLDHTRTVSYFQNSAYRVLLARCYTFNSTTMYREAAAAGEIVPALSAVAEQQVRE